MRKAYKKKRRSCALCKTQKMGWAKRWKTKDMDLLRAMEKEARSAQMR